MTALWFKLPGEKRSSWRPQGGRVQRGKGPSQVENLDAGPGDAGPTGEVLQHHNNPSRDGVYVEPTFTHTAGGHVLAVRARHEGVELAQARLRRRPMGRIALVQILTTRAFPNDVADRAVRLVYDGVTEQAVAARFLRSLPRRFKDPVREARRRVALLATRGFPEDLIEPLLISGLSDQGQS